VGHLCTNLPIFGICRLRTIEGIFFIFEASRGGGEGDSVDLGGGAHFYRIHGWAGWVWRLCAAVRAREQRV